MEMKEWIGYGIVGCGYSGGIHGENLTKLAGARLLAVWDTDPERAGEFATRFHTEAAGSLEELCEHPEIDALFITTPNDSHVLPAVMGAEKGKHIFCEKPVALSLSDVEAMLQAARKNQVHFFAAHTTNFIPGVGTAKRLLLEGAIGRLLAIEAVHTDWAGPQKEVGWKQKKEISGGHLYHHMHEAELICQLAGLPRCVYAMGKNMAHFGPGFGNEEDMMMLLMDFPSPPSAGQKSVPGLLASLTIGSAFHQGDHFVKLQGEKGGIRLDFKESCVTAEYLQENGVMTRQQFPLHKTEAQDQERREGYKANHLDAGKGFGKPGMKTSSWMKSIFAEELGCFHQLVKTGEISPEYGSLADGTAARRCLKLLDGAMESIKRQGPVFLKQGPMPLGIIGLDSSHAEAFSRILNGESEPFHIPDHPVIAAYPGERSEDFDMSYRRMDSITEAVTKDWGVRLCPDIPSVMKQVEGVFLEQVDARKRVEQFEAIASFGKPVFVDKPFALSSRDCRRMLSLAEEKGIPLLSASALRFADSLTEALRACEKYPIHGADFFGPMPFTATQNGYFWYGIHMADMLYRVMGRGCRSVRAVHEEHYDIITGIWKDGRLGTIRGLRTGSQNFGGSIFCGNTHVSVDVSKDKRGYYESLLEAVIQMFDQGVSPVSLLELEEIIRFLEAANESRETGREVLL